MNKRTYEQSIITNWITEINKPIFFCITVLITFGLLISLTINPGTSRYLNNNLFAFFNIQALYLAIGFLVFISISLIETKYIKLFSVILFTVFFALLVLTILFGDEIKGSRRWISFGSFSLMPIELVKPVFCVVLALILNNQYQGTKISSHSLSALIYISVASILVLQPDISQFFLLSAIYFGSVLMSGFSIIILTVIVVFGLLSFVMIYLLNFNVQNRINSFLFPNEYDVSQTEISLQAIKQGGIIGVGPGNGLLKNKIPEANSDYIFSVVAEEYGLIGCTLILLIFFIISYQGFKKIYGNNDHFIQICLFTLILYVCLQALIHIGVNIRLIPTTGITLPFISYGGSSVLGMSIAAGLILLFSKNRHIRE